MKEKIKEKKRNQVNIPILFQIEVDSLDFTIEAVIS